MRSSGSVPQDSIPQRLEQTNIFQPEDVIPVPCHPDSLAMAYARKRNGKATPLTSMIPPDVLIKGAKSTILYEQEPAVREGLPAGCRIFFVILSAAATKRTAVAEEYPLVETRRNIMEFSPIMCPSVRTIPPGYFLSGSIV